ncbi:hypothetical protein [Bradyrhizobium sp. RDM4]|uniref:hypothetical protein n=1 Tax=Bradyrhizobium sp. RDM4 TaxID=3378765 RepID=UPI0038FC3412
MSARKHSGCSAGNASAQRQRPCGDADVCVCEVVGRTTCIHTPDEPQAARETIIEECAKVLDEAAQDWRRIRDPGMANNAAAYAKKIRALALRQRGSK